MKLLTVCRLVKRKNLPLAGDAVTRFDNRHDGDVAWRVVGKGPQAEVVESHPIADARGYIDDLQAEYDWGDAFFLPSKHEAFGIVFLEALAARLPVVTADTGGQTDIVRDGVGEVAPPDADALADALERVADNYEEYNAATAGYVTENFSREGMVDDYERLFQTLS